MSRLCSLRPSPSLAFLPFLVVLPLLLAAGSCESPLTPTPGVPNYQKRAILQIPGAPGIQTNTAGGNLIVERTDLSIDTRLGTYAISGVYNSATQESREWRWSFEMQYDGAVFIDDTGTRHDVSTLADGDPIPGTSWTRLSSTEIVSRGGMLYSFHAEEHHLLEIYRRSSHTPRLSFQYEPFDPNGSGSSRLDRIVQCTASGCSLVYDLSYDNALGEHGRLISITDRAGRQATFTYDAHGRLAEARDGLDVAKSWPGFRYDYKASSSLLTSLTNSEGERVELAYQPASANTVNRVTSIMQVGAQQPIWTFSYEAPSDGTYRTKMIDPLGDRTIIRYDAQGRVKATVNGEAEETRWQWSGLRPSKKTDPDGTSTTFSWTNDQLSSKTTASGNTVRFDYESGGVNRANPMAPPMRHVEDDLGLVLHASYDAQGRLTATSNGENETTSLTYSDNQMIRSITSPAGVTLELLDYGDHGHPRRLRIDGDEATRVYDEVGNLLQGPDITFDSGPGLGGVVSRSFDADRNVSSVELSNLDLDIEPSGAKTLTVEHRSDGRRTRVNRPYGGDTVYTYDAIGRLVERSEKASNSWHSTTFGRDALGRQVSRQRENGMRTEVDYDAAGRVISRRILEDGALQSTSNRDYQDGHLVSLQDSVHEGATETYTYDSSGRVSAINFPDGETLELTYDLRSRMTHLLFLMPSGSLLRWVSIDYDNAGRETAVWDDGVEAVTHTYAEGQLSASTFANGLTRSFGYDSGDGRLASATTVDADGTTLESTLYHLPKDDCKEGYDEACFQTHTQTFGSPSSDSLVSHLMGPAEDDTQPLTQAGKRVAWSGSRSFVGLYSYDELSNLRRAASSDMPDTGTELRYNDERNRLLCLGETDSCSHEYAYDESGYVVERNNTTIDWDGAGRVTRIDTHRFKWDTQGRPVSQEVAGQAIDFRFGGLVQADPSGNPLALELRKFRIDLATGERRYRHYDFRGNVKLVSNGEGEIVTHYEYKAYGVNKVFGSEVDFRRFAQGRGRAGLYILGHRLYDPLVGRFLAPDPEYQLINQYAYALGNPIGLWDPSGLRGRVLGYTAGEFADAFKANVVVFAALTVAGVPQASTALAASTVGLVVFNEIENRGGFPEGNAGPDLNRDGHDANDGSGSKSSSGFSPGSFSTLSRVGGPGFPTAPPNPPPPGPRSTPSTGSWTDGLGDAPPPGYGGGAPGPGGGGCAPTQLSSVRRTPLATAILIGCNILLAAAVGAYHYRRNTRACRRKDHSDEVQGAK